jgi:hypothetical protein
MAARKVRFRAIMRSHYQGGRRTVHHPQDEDYVAELPDQAVENSWLGYEGASAEELAELENRLGLSLQRVSPTYKWMARISPFIDDIWSTREVDFFRFRNQQWFDSFFSDDAPNVSKEEHLLYGDEQEPYLFRAEN